MVQDLMRTRATRIASLVVLLVAADHVALAGRTMSRCYDLILGYGEGTGRNSRPEAAGLGCRLGARLLGVEDAGYDNKAIEPPAG